MKKTFKHKWIKKGAENELDWFCVKCEKTVNDLLTEIEGTIKNGHAKMGENIFSIEFDLYLEDVMDTFDIKTLVKYKPCRISAKDFKLKELLK